MIQSARSIALLFAKVGAVAFALTACGYLVVTAQRRANPTPSPAVAGTSAESGGSPLMDESFLQGSKSAVLEPTESVGSEAERAVELQLDDSTFLSSSKSLNWTPHPNPPPLVFPPLEAMTEPAASADQNSRFLYSSKSGKVSSPLRPPLIPGTVTMPAATPTNDPPNPTVPQATASESTATKEPVFLPSSKVKVLSPLRPQTTTSGTPSTSEPVFLPSSKSLRLGEIKTPPPKPAPAPSEPPKNP